MQQGGSTHIRPVFVVGASLILVAGFFAVPYLEKYAENTLTVKADDLSENGSVLEEKISRETNAYKLMRLGKQLTNNQLYEEAILVLTRAQTLAPNNRDINLLLAWCLLDSIQKTTATDKKTANNRINTAEDAVTIAYQIDPLSHEVQQLAHIMSTLRSDQEKDRK